MAHLPPPSWVWKPRAATRDIPRHSLNVPGSGLPLEDFFGFADFASEIQDMIWRFAACHPRIIELLITRYKCKFEGKTPSPKMLYATAGARAIALESYVLTPNVVFERETEPPNWANVAMLNGQLAGNAVVPAANLVGPNNGLPALNAQIPAFMPGLAALALTGATLPLPLPAVHALPAPANMSFSGVANVPLPIQAQPNDAPQATQGHQNNPNDTAVVLTASAVPRGPKLRFYINFGNGNFSGDIFKLIVGDTPVDFEYPSALITEDNSVKISQYHNDADGTMDDLSRLYRAPGNFPGSAPLPAYFKDITRIALDVKLQPEIFGNTARKNAGQYIPHAVEHFWTMVQDRMDKFPKLKRVDLLVSNVLDNAARYEGCKKGMEVRQWRWQNIKESDGLSFSKIGLGLMERELLCLTGSDHTNNITKELKMSNGKTRVMPEVQLCVVVPRLLPRAKYLSGN